MLPPPAPIDTISIVGCKIGRRCNFEEVLSKYQKTRKTPNMLMAAFVQLFKDGFEDKNPWIKFGRNLAFQVTTQNKWLKRKFIREASGLI